MDNEIKTVESAEVQTNTRPIRDIIYFVRGQQVLLDSDLAALYKVDTKVFNQAVKRNIERFPAEFRFQLTQEEYDSLKSQIVTSKKGVRRKAIYAICLYGAGSSYAICGSKERYRHSGQYSDHQCICRDAPFHCE